MSLSALELDEYRCSMSSSKAPVIWLGESYGTTRADLWCRMTGRQPWPDLDGELSIQLGNVIEPVCADRFSKRTGLQVRRPIGTWRHPTDPDVVAHVDFEAVIDGDLVAPLECKWTDAGERDEWGSDGTDEAPMKHIVQVQHQLACEPGNGQRRADFGFIVAILGRSEVRAYKVRRSPPFIAALLDAEAEFMRCVRSDVPPEPRLPEEWRTIYRNSTPGRVVAADAAIILTIAKREAMIARRDALEAQVAALDCEVIRYARDAEAITIGTDPILSLETTKAGARPIRVVQKNWRRAKELLRQP